MKFLLSFYFIIKIAAFFPRLNKSKKYIASKVNSVLNSLNNEDVQRSLFLESDFKVSDAECLYFMRQGHLQLKDIFKTTKNDPSVDANDCILSGKLRSSIIEMFATDTDSKLAAYRHKVRVLLNREDASELSLDECSELLATVDQADVPFMQLFNIWKKCPIAHSISHSPILGRIAADLLNVDCVRLYQDSVFIKSEGDGPTLWHSDLNMAPFDTNDFLTLWIPLQDVPSEAEGGSGLTFASGSHRDFALPYWNDIDSTDMTERYPISSYDGYQLGDISAHHGWCLHSAPGNSLKDTRYAYTVSFVVDGAPLLQEEGQIRIPDNEDYQSYADWIDDIGWGGYAEHPLTPVVYSRDFSTDNSA